MNDFGALILGHGTRDPKGTALFLQLEEMVRAKIAPRPTAVGFMEFAAPTTADAAEKLTAAGAKRIAVAPVFLSSVGHMSEDVPQAIREAAERVAPIPIAAASYVGGSRKVAELSAKRFNESCAVNEPFCGRNPSQIRLEKPHLRERKRIIDYVGINSECGADASNVPLEETLLILAAHGSPEPEAFEEFAAFAHRRAELTPVGKVEACFSMMGGPRLADVLEEAAVGPFRRVVVQPHFILPGRLSDMVRDEAEKMRLRRPEKEWLTTAPLGIDELLADAIVETLAALTFPSEKDASVL